MKYQLYTNASKNYQWLLVVISEFVRTLRSSVWDIFNNFILIDATDWSKIRHDQKRLFFGVSLFPNFSRTLPLTPQFLKSRGLMLSTLSP